MTTFSMPFTSLAERGDQLAEDLGVAVAGGVRDVHDGGSGRHDRLDHPAEEVAVGARRVLGVELHVLHEAARELHGRHAALDGHVTADVELVVEVAVRRRRCRCGCAVGLRP